MKKYKHLKRPFLGWLSAIFVKTITDHVCQNNHITDWKASRIVEQESDKFKRWIKESIHIRANTPNVNRDEGAHQLSLIWS